MSVRRHGVNLAKLEFHTLQKTLQLDNVKKKRKKTRNTGDNFSLTVKYTTYI
jgi:hypothetical protein